DTFESSFTENAATTTAGGGKGEAAARTRSSRRVRPRMPNVWYVQEASVSAHGWWSTPTTAGTRVIVAAHAVPATRVPQPRSITGRVAGTPSNRASAISRTSR